MATRWATLVGIAASCLGCVPEPAPSGPGPAGPGDPPLDPAVVRALSMPRVRDDVDWLASDARGGRVPGTPGHAEAVAWIADQLAATGLEPVGDAWVHPFPLTLDRDRFGLDERGQVFAVPRDQTGANLLGLWPGVDPVARDEIVLLLAHYDHLGVTSGGDPFNGAFDDAVAVCALIELARVWSAHDVRFPRSVAFLLTDAEEDGLKGAEHAVEAGLLPLEDLVVVLSADPIGRPVLADFGPLFVIGAERSPELTAAIREVQPFVAAPVHRLSRTPVIGFASDQDAYWNAPTPVPSLWITSGGMSFYHTPADDPITIDYRSVRDHLGAVAQLAARLAGDPALRPVDHGPRPMSVDDLAEAVRIVDGALGSAELTDEERALGRSYRETLAEGVASGDPVDGRFVATYAELLLYVIQELTPAHPGPVPPPFPDP